MADDSPILTFLGGAGTVTGSKYLVRAGGRQVRAHVAVDRTTVWLGEER